MNIADTHGDIKAHSVGADKFRRTRERALSLIMESRLTKDDRIQLWDIAHADRDLTAADAWAVNRIAGSLDEGWRA